MHKGEGTVHSYNTNEWAVYDTTSGRKDGPREGRKRAQERPVWRVRFPRSAISRVADAHGTKGGAGDGGREGNERRKTLRAALKERSPAAGRAGIPSPVPEARASRAPISGVFRVSIAPIHLICDSGRDAAQGPVYSQPVCFFYRFYFLSSGHGSDVRIILSSCELLRL